MVNCVKETAHSLASALAADGVTDIFSSPGSRNAPLIIAFARHQELTVRPVVDERSAAFIALGHALVSRRPAALVCTSGTALLNYAPAIAEAYYRKVALIVISADRPAEWIGQDDSQTMAQPGALGNIVKASYTLRGEISGDRDRWMANRVLNEALQTALTRRPGPVHINVSFDEPLTSETVELPRPGFRKIDLMLPPRRLAVEDARRLASEATNREVLVVGGFCPPSSALNRAFSKIAPLPGVVVVADALANLNVLGILSRPDLMLDSELLRKPSSRPSLLITFGGGLLSKKLKEYLRRAEIAEHWHVGENDSLIDSYFSLTRRIEISEDEFFPRFANAMEYLARGREPGMGEFKSLWHEAAFRCEESQAARQLTGDSAKWSDRSAILTLLSSLPREWNLQLSNGLTPRYAVIGDACRFHRRDCNRGVSGIDGSVSTALGASLAYKGTTVLLTGDTSMQYDIAALSSDLLSPRLKIVVINNGGGGIFRKIASTRALPELERYFACDLRLPLASLAEAYGLAYFKASSADELARSLTGFISTADRPALLEIQTATTKG